MCVTVPPMDYFRYYELWQNYLDENEDTDVLIIHYENLKTVRVIMFNHAEKRWRSAFDCPSVYSISKPSRLSLGTMAINQTWKHQIKLFSHLDMFILLLKENVFVNKRWILLCKTMTLIFDFRTAWKNSEE